MLPIYNTNTDNIPGIHHNFMTSEHGKFFHSIAFEMFLLDYLPSIFVEKLCMRFTIAVSEQKTKLLPS
jgi:hypothetical protein